MFFGRVPLVADSTADQHGRNACQSVRFEFWRNVSTTCDDGGNGWNDKTADAVLLLGPLYHLTARADRIRALTEARRVLKPAGLVFAVGISRFASTMDGLRSGFLKDAQFADIVDGDLKDGQHRNPTTRPEYFTDAFFHHPDELRQEVTEAGFVLTGVYGLEGPAWLMSDFDEWWANPAYRERLLNIARVLETEPSMLGVNAHLMVVAVKSA